MRIGILYDAGSGDWDPKDVAAVLTNVNEIRRCLRRAGHVTARIPVRLGDTLWLRKVQQADLIFNLCEGVNGIARYEDYVVACLDLTRVPYTGCPSWPVTIAHRKHVANTLLEAAGIPIPPFVLARGTTLPTHLKYPVIVKPASEDASVGIDGTAVCVNRKALLARLSRVQGMWDEILIQEYIPGRELNVGFIGSQMLPISEIQFQNLPNGTWPIVSYAAKWDTGSAEDLGTVPNCPADLDRHTASQIGQVARAAWELIGQGRGYGRVDIRLSPEGRPFVLEVNPNPDLSTDAGLARMARARGWSYDTLVLEVVEEALSRDQVRRAAEAQYLKIPA
ncbi:MAG: ATP-grasp domain-containing protein [Gemmatimonadota bacterium]